MSSWYSDFIRVFSWFDYLDLRERFHWVVSFRESEFAGYRKKQATTGDTTRCFERVSSWRGSRVICVSASVLLIFTYLLQWNLSWRAQMNNFRCFYHNVAQCCVLCNWRTKTRMKKKCQNLLHRNWTGRGRPQIPDPRSQTPNHFGLWQIRCPVFDFLLREITAVP